MIMPKYLWAQIYGLYERDVFVGLQVNDEGITAWVTDRHFVNRAEQQIDAGPDLLMGAQLKRWLAEQAPAVAVSLATPGVTSEVAKIRAPR